MNKRVVVTGMGIVASNATGVPDFLEALKSGRSGLRFLPQLRDLNFGCQVGGIPDISQPAAQEFFEQYHFAEAGDNIKYALLASAEAWKDAGLSIPDPMSTETDWDSGVIVGSGVGNIDIFSDRIFPQVAKGDVRRLRSNIAEFTMFSAVSANISFLLALGNQVSANSSACSTGTESIILAAERIRTGQARRMLAGSAEIASPYVWGCFDSMRVLCRKYNDSPETASRPMSGSAGGFIPSSGAGILVLEELESALERKAPIYCEIAGWALNSGGQRNGGTMQAPGPQGIRRCMAQAFNDAQIQPSQVDAISGHLSSTMADPLEVGNWAYALNRKGKDFPYINSLKSLTGHALGASGTIETIAAILEMKHHFLFPSANCEDLHPEIAEMIDERCIPHTTMTSCDLNVIAKASFGFGDINSCLILKRI